MGYQKHLFAICCCIGDIVTRACYQRYCCQKNADGAWQCFRLNIFLTLVLGISAWFALNIASSIIKIFLSWYCAFLGFILLKTRRGKLSRFFAFSMLGAIWSIAFLFIYVNFWLSKCIKTRLSSSSNKVRVKYDRHSRLTNALAESLLGQHDIADTSKATCCCLYHAKIRLKNNTGLMAIAPISWTTSWKLLVLFDRKPAEMPIMTAIYKVLDHQNLSKDEMHEVLLSCLI